MTLTAGNTTLSVTKKYTSFWKNVEMVENGKGILEPDGRGSAASDLEIDMDDNNALTMSGNIEKSLIMCQTMCNLRTKNIIFVVQPKFLLYV